MRNIDASVGAWDHIGIAAIALYLDRPLLEPNRADIGAHLLALFSPYEGLGYFEVRALHPACVWENRATRPRSRWFDTTDAGIARGIDHAVNINRVGFNAYATPNLLRTGGPTDNRRATADPDVAIANFLWFDFDGGNISDLLGALAAVGVEPAFRVATGSIPSARGHIYMALRDVTTDLAMWSDAMRRAAHHFGSDPSVHNPSRVLRLAGTIAYPNQRKIDRGYVCELTRFLPGEGAAIDLVDFAAILPPADEKTGRRTSHGAGHEAETEHGGGGREMLPRIVVATCLAAIPPYGAGNRSQWLDVAYGCRDAGPHVRDLFEAWQRRSPAWESIDDHVWESLHPTPGSYLSLFRHAKQHSPDWWRSNPETEAWLRREWEKNQSPVAKGVSILRRHRPHY